MKAYPFLIQQDTLGEPLHPLANRERIYDEAWLQELLRRHAGYLLSKMAERGLLRRGGQGRATAYEKPQF